MTAPQIVYLCGSGHSGSTLLDMILGGHPLVSSVGEAHRLYLNARNASVAHRCTCGQPVRECAFWNRVDAEVRRMLRSDRHYLLDQLPTTDPAYLDVPDNTSGLDLVEAKPKLFNPTANRIAMLIGSSRLWRSLAPLSADVRVQRQAIRNSNLIYQAIRNTHKTPVVLDSTKTPARLKGIYLDLKHTDVKFRALYLIRDGRAVCHSRMQRQGVSMTQAATIWNTEQRKLRLTLFTVPSTCVTYVSYEDLCRTPTATIRRLCRAFDIPFIPELLDFRHGHRHNLGGNTMRWRSGESRIRLNQKWKTSLSDGELDSFDAVAGSTNRRFGYTT